MINKHIGIIDLGSNSARLVLYKEAAPGIFFEIDNMKQILRLSAHMTEEGKIDEEGMRSALECMRLFRQFCDARQVHDVIGVATAAVRQAVNGQDLVAFIRAHTGFSLRILSGEEEAFYGYLAVVNSMHIENAFTVDIGGGSTEITWIRARDCVAKISFPFGAVNLTRRFFQGDVPAREELAKLETFLWESFSQVDWLRAQPLPLVAMGGAARNIGRMKQKAEKYSLSSLHHYVMQPSDVEQFYLHLRKMPVAKRKKVKGLSADRADIIVAALAVFHTLLQITNSQQFVISTRGLRDGIMFAHLVGKKEALPAAEVSMYSTRQLMCRYEVNRQSAEHVSQLALSLFDQMVAQRLLTPAANDRHLLQLAALLHDVGYAVNVYDTKEHTYYLLTHVLLTGLTHRERLIVALTASYKSKKRLAKLCLLHSDILSADEREKIIQLAVIVQLARCLDRSAVQLVKRIELKKEADGYGLTIVSAGTKEAWIEYMLVQECLLEMSDVFGHPFSFRTVEEAAD